MKKYIMFIAVALFVSACGNSGKTDATEELSQEEQIVFVEEESEAIDASVKEVQSEVDDSETKVNELLKDI
jgi:PBP1b-binding outer membrane lipoprotein LpoB